MTECLGAQLYLVGQPATCPGPTASWRWSRASGRPRRPGRGSAGRASRPHPRRADSAPFAAVRRSRRYRPRSVHGERRERGRRARCAIRHGSSVAHRHGASICSNAYLLRFAVHGMLPADVESNASTVMTRTAAPGIGSPVRVRGSEHRGPRFRGHRQQSPSAAALWVLGQLPGVAFRADGGTDHHATLRSPTPGGDLKCSEVSATAMFPALPRWAHVGRAPMGRRPTAQLRWATRRP